MNPAQPPENLSNLTSEESLSSHIVNGVGPGLDLDDKCRLLSVLSSRDLPIVWDSQHPEAFPSTRLGPPLVTTHLSSLVGSIETDQFDPSVIEATSSFASFHASAAVHDGQWYYEVTLLSSGKMQIGVCTLTPRFTSTEGVGDFARSFSFDGSRARKWGNGDGATYGEAWAAGDVIGVKLDLTAGCISFSRNGRDLGVAFRGVGGGEKHYLFPAMSLGAGEKVRVNYGDRAHRHRPEGFLPFAAPPSESPVASARALLAALSRLFALSRGPPPPPAPAWLLSCGVSLIRVLAELLLAPGVVPQALVPAIAAWGEEDTECLVDLLHSAVEEADLTQVVALVMAELGHRCTERDLAFLYNNDNNDNNRVDSPVAVALRLCRQRRWLQMWLESPRMARTLEDLMARKGMTPADLRAVAGGAAAAAAAPSAEALTAMEGERESLLALLFSDREPLVRGMSPARLALDWLRELVSRNLRWTRNVRPAGLSSPTVLANVYSGLMALLASDRDPLGPGTLLTSLVHADPELPRVGGLLSHLLKEPEFAEAAASEEALPRATAREALWDACVKLYNVGMALHVKAATAAQQQSAVTAQYVATLDAQIAALPEGARGEFASTRVAFVAENQDAARVLALSLSLVSRAALPALCQHVVEVVLASARERSLPLLPECYFEALVEAFHALRRLESAAAVASRYPALVQGVATVLVDHFSDARLVNMDLRDTLLQSMCVVFQYPELLAAFADNEGARATLAESLLSVFNHRFWVSVVNILLRFVDSKCAVFLGRVTEALEASPTARRDFFNTLLNNLNWTLTELSVALRVAAAAAAAAAAAGGADAHAQAQTVKKATIMFELSVSMLRLLCHFMPQASEGGEAAGAGVLLRRIAEVALCVLSVDFDGVARVLGQAGPERALQGDLKATIVGPCAGIVAAAWGRDSDGFEEALAPGCTEKHLQALGLPPFPAGLGLRLAEKMANRARRASTQAEDDLCSICCTDPQDTAILPCRHRACRQCIDRHTLNSTKCFFCNAEIKGKERL